jgi:hypothetical protein
LGIPIKPYELTIWWQSHRKLFITWGDPAAIQPIEFVRGNWEDEFIREASFVVQSVTAGLANQRVYIPDF